jgi:phosphonate transport system permease protein
VILADEPVSALDPSDAESVVSLLASLADEGMSVLAVLHQPALARRFAHRIVGISDGRVAFASSPSRCGFRFGRLEGWRGMADFVDQSFPPDPSVPGSSIEAAGVTLYIGLLGTTFSVPFALLLGVLASRVTAPNAAVYQIARSILSILRSVPDVVFALIFVTAVGLGPFAGVPTVLPQMVGLLLYRFDVNVRSSLVLGLVGAGGIGFLINQSIKLFRFDQIVTHIIVVVVVVVIVDQFSAYVRRKLA